MKWKHEIARRTCYCVLIVFTTHVDVIFCQPTLIVRNAMIKWPDVEVDVIPECNGELLLQTNKQDYRLWENGKEIHNFTLRCPDTVNRCPISVALVFDASGSMLGIPIEAAKSAGLAFLDMMEIGVDEAAVVRFSTTATLLHEMTPEIPFLKQSILGINVGGSTALWSGITVGLQEVISKGKNPCRAVIVISDGRDNASSETQAAVMNLARSNRIPVFTIGLGRSIDSVGLYELAEQTGARFFSAPAPDQLLSVYREIARFIQFGSIACTINYTGTCIRDTVRRIQVQFDYCGGIDSDDVVIATPENIGMIIPVTFSLKGTVVAGGTQFSVPVRLETPLRSTKLPPVDGTIQYDTTLLHLVTVRMAPGSIYDNGVITYDRISGGVRFRIDGSPTVNDTGDIIELDFIAINPPDTIYSPVTLARWSFDEGCFIPSVAASDICIVPCNPVPGIFSTRDYLCFGDTLSLSSDPGFDSYVWYRNGNEIAVGVRSLDVTEGGTYFYRASTRVGCSSLSSMIFIRTIARRNQMVRANPPEYLRQVGEFTIPLVITPPLPPFEFTRISFRVQMPSRMRIIGTDDVVHQWTDAVEVTADGTITLSGIPTDSVYELAQLRFAFVELPAVPEVDTISFLENAINLQCVQSFEMLPIIIPTDGFCQLIVRRKIGVGNHPNPFSNQTTIRISIPQTEYVLLRVLNVLGVEIHRLAEGVFPRGDHEYHFNAVSLPSGFYVVELVSQSGVAHVLTMKGNVSN